MQKKTILIFISLIVLTSCGITFAIVYLHQKESKPKNRIISIDELDDQPEYTGGLTSYLDESEIKEGAEISNLQKKLPLTTELFTIFEYDFSRGKFVVLFDGYPKENREQNFLEWLGTSEFLDIPQDRFDVK